ncbi:MAG: hypothetical protein AAFU49_23865 [Pseudomonadota bacterium]
MRHRLVLSTSFAAALVFTPMAAAAGIDLPSAVDRGARVSLTLSPAPQAEAVLSILPIKDVAGAETVSGPPLHSQTLAPGTATAELSAPSEAGSYLVLLKEGGEDRDRAFLEVVATPRAGFALPVEARAAEAFDVSIGADGEGDRLVLVNADSGEVIEERRVTADEADEGRASVIAPGRTGRYRLSHLDGETGRQVASGTFRVDATKALIAASAVVPAGAPFELRRIGPGGADHVVRIETEDGEAVREQSLAGSEAPFARFSMAAPGLPGRYLIRYVSLVDGALLSEAPLIVTAN